MCNNTITGFGLSMMIGFIEAGELGILFVKPNPKIGSKTYSKIETIYLYFHVDAS